MNVDSLFYCCCCEGTEKEEKSNDFNENNGFKSGTSRVKSFLSKNHLNVTLIFGYSGKQQLCNKKRVNAKQKRD